MKDRYLHHTIRVGQHNLSEHPLYKIWAGMKNRCNSNHSKNEYWNGRGIKYCKEWENFIPFFNWAINNGYKKGLTLDRIDNDGNYCPENCRFTTWSVQNSNKRKPKWFIKNPYVYKKRF